MLSFVLGNSWGEEILGYGVDFSHVYVIVLSINPLLSFGVCKASSACLWCWVGMAKKCYP